MKVFCVISHTHWDREWYMPLESMRLRLCDLIDHCLAIMEREPSYIFHLDAQTIVLEDYLAFRPSKRELLKKRVAEGRLVVGPWYLQNDFYLTSGESTIRNLLEGHQLAEEFGGCAKVGYAPDQFGNPRQMPQILADFGIDNFIFGRGLPKQFPDGSKTPSEFIWEGPDGTRALAINLRFWYNNAQHFSPELEKAKLLVENNERGFEGVALTPYILMMNGVDHLEPQGDLLPILDELNEAWQGEKSIRQYRMPEYVDAVREFLADKKEDMYVCRDELRWSGDVDCLKSTLSSRFYLKAANVKAQAMLENKLEPLYTMLELAGAKGVYSLDHFRYMWKELMKNHPHDSICGCSRDEVHDHMEDNYARLSTTTADMLQRGMRCAAVHLDTAGMRPDNYILAVANTTQAVMSGVVTATVDIPKSDGAAGLRITDGEGKPADFVVLSKREALRDGFSPLNLPGNFPVDRYVVELAVKDAASFSLRGYVVEGAPDPVALSSGGPSGTALENDAYRIEADAQGRVHLLDKRTGRQYADVLDIEDTCDRGDSYLYYSDGSGPLYGSAFPATVTASGSRLAGELCIARDLVLPARFDFAAKRRSEETAVTHTELRIRLTAGDALPEVTFIADNRSCDHRLRLLVKTGVQAGGSVADCPFDVLERSDAAHASETQGKTMPNSTFAALEAGGQGFAVLTEGAQEFEHMEKDAALAFTLVRSTSVISRNHATMEASGGDQWEAPGNQCLRRMSGRFALLPYDGGWLEAGVPVKAVQFLAGFSVEYMSCDEKRFCCGRPAVQDSQLAECYFLPDPYEGVRVPDNKSLLTVEGDGLLVTALKLAQDGETAVLRAVNLAEESRTAVIHAPGAVYRSTMSETGAEKIGENTVRAEMGARKIATWKIG